MTPPLPVPQPAMPTGERPWLYAWLAAMATLIGGLLLFPGMPLDEKLLVVMQGLCAQQNNLFLGGTQLPICARCTGIYTALLLTLGLVVLRGDSRAAGLPHWSVLAALVGAVLILAVDGLNSLADDIGIVTLYSPQNVLRTVTGMGAGIGLAVLVLLLVNYGLRANPEPSRPVLRGWRDIVLLLLLNVALLAAIFGNLPFLYFPLAVASMVGMLGTLYLVCTLVCAVLLGYTNSMYHLRDLARPATLALVPTVAVLAGMGYLRAWLEGMGALG